MPLKEFVTTRRAVATADDVLLLDALARSIGHAYPSDPDATRLLMEIAVKRARLATGTGDEPRPSAPEATAP